MKLPTLLVTPMEKGALLLSTAERLWCQWKLVTQRLSIGILNCLEDILLDMIGKRKTLDPLFVGESSLKPHTWLSKHYSLFSVRISVMRNYASNTIIQRILEKEQKLIRKLGSLRG